MPLHLSHKGTQVQDLRHWPNLSVRGRIIYLPIYMLMFIQQHPLEEKQIYHFDLTHLKA